MRPRVFAFLLLLLTWPAMRPAAAAAQPTWIRVSGDPAVMSVAAAPPGAPPAVVVDASTTYDLKARQNNRRIRAWLDAPLPSGVKLTIELQAPAGAVSAGEVELTTSPQDVVVQLPKNVTAYGLAITYRLTATAGSGTMPLTTRVVTLEVTT